MDKVQIGQATLYHGDCREVLPTLERVDAVVTDPPYGIGLTYASYDDNESQWFDLINSVVPELRRLARFVVMPICKISRMGWWYTNHQPDWLIAWNKGSPGHRSAIGFNSWEPHVCWGKPDRPMHDIFHAGGMSLATGNGHPCPKPISWANWLVSRAALEGQSVLDPFMGSGTTGVACMNLGRQFIGIEMDRQYFDIACERIQAAQSQTRLFPEPASAPRQIDGLAAPDGH